MKINPQFWKDKRVFITGHTGFKGSWLSLWLLNIGSTVKGFSLEPSTDPSLFKILGLEKQMKSVIGDIRDKDHISTELKSFEPDIVFHLAAQPLVKRSYLEPVYTFETNIMGTINVFEALRSAKGVRSFVCITSDKCYENREWVWGYRETDPVGGYDPYSASKGCAELVVASYRNSFFHPAQYNKTHRCAIASARAGNVIGGGDWAADRLIPDCIRSLSKEEMIVLRNPQSIRPWQYVLEPLYGYLILAQCLFEQGVEYGEAWNFGPSEESFLSVESIVKKSIEFWGTGSYQAERVENQHEANMLKLDTSKSRSRLGLKPIYTVQKSVEETINWYKTYHQNKTDIYEYSTAQINYFEQTSNE